MLAVALQMDKDPAAVLLPEIVLCCSTARLPMKPKLPVRICSASVAIAQLPTRMPRKCRYWAMSLKLFSIRKLFLVVPVRAIFWSTVAPSALACSVPAVLSIVKVVEVFAVILKTPLLALAAPLTRT
jgi:hypothetical protein